VDLELSFGGRRLNETPCQERSGISPTGRAFKGPPPKSFGFKGLYCSFG